MQVWIGLVTLLIGLGIMIGCAVPMSKEKDKTTPKYKGLIAGVVIGVLINAFFSFSQTIENIDFSSQGNNVLITYDLVNCLPNEKQSQYKNHANYGELNLRNQW